MITYLMRRLGYAAIMLVLVSFVSFLIIDLPPGDYMDQKLAELSQRGDRSAETRIEEYRAKYGLDKPLLTRYWMWASKFVKGDFGDSFQFERPVKDILGERLLMTILLAGFSLAVMWAVAIPLGVYSAVNQYSLGDQIMTTIAFIGMGMPNFLLALLVLFFAVVVLDADITGLFSREFRDAPWSLAKLWDLFKHMWIPALIAAVTGSAGLIR
ncbi:MAG: ABC transporter permease, partial [Anaerolineae bacterium]|nr:ABC transporter permease [Anaerolineae bacterium]